MEQVIINLHSSKSS